MAPRRELRVGDRVKETTITGKVRMHTVESLAGTAKYPRAGERYIVLREDLRENGVQLVWTLPESTLRTAKWLEVTAAHNA